jgi:pilus assembly protein CpaF
MVDAIDLSKAGQLAEEELRAQLRALAAHLCSLEPVGLEPDDREAMVREIMDEIYGFGLLEPLMNDPEVAAVHVNGPHSVCVERHGRLERTDLRFADEEHLLTLIQRLAGRAGRRIDEGSPMVDARLPDGSRLDAVIPPLARRGPTLSVRRCTSPLLFEDVLRLGTLATEMADFLALAVRARLNVLISGGTGAGRTTMLHNLGRFIPPGERVVTIEQTAELQLRHPDVVSLEMRPAHLEGRGGIPQCGLLKSSLRMRPDRILLDEAQGCEVWELLQAMSAGCDGSMLVVRANDARDAIDRLERMAALSEVDLSTPVARRHIASALHVLVHVARLGTGERKVTRISELVAHRDGTCTIEDIFVYRLSGVDASGRADGAFYATGYEPTVLNRLGAAGLETPPWLFEPRELEPGGDDD